MENSNFSSPEVISKILKEHYQDLPENLTDFVAYATPLEIGFEIDSKNTISLTFSEGFKGYLVDYKKDQNNEIRLALINTFFGSVKDIPALNLVEVIIKDDLPKKKFLKIYLRDLTNKLIYTTFQNALENGKLDEFTKLIELYGRKQEGTTLAPLSKEEKQLFSGLFNEVNIALRKALHETDIPLDELTEYINAKETEKTEIVTELFITYINTLKGKEKN